MRGALKRDANDLAISGERSRKVVLISQDVGNLS
jgi:hypothetical protein